MGKHLRAEGATSIAFSPDGKRLVVGGNLKVALWELATGEQKWSVKVSNSDVDLVVFSPSGEAVASGSAVWNGTQYIGTIKIWDTAIGALQCTLHHGEILNALAFSPDGKILASGDSDAVNLWNPGTGSLKETLTAHAHAANALVFSPRGNTLAIAGRKVRKKGEPTYSHVTLWDLRHKQTQRVITTPLEGSFLSIAISPDGEVLAGAFYSRSSDEPYQILLWDLQSGEIKNALKGHTGIIRSLAYSADGAMLASASDDKTVRLWDTKTMALRGHLQYRQGVTSVAFSPAGTVMASASGSKSVGLWTMEELMALRATVIKDKAGHDLFIVDSDTLEGANLEKATLASAVLWGAQLRGSILRGANLKGANLSSADLTDADLQGADICQADLSHANLTRAKLAHANGAFAHLKDANLTGANLEDADLEGATVEGAILQDATYSEKTMWPNGFDPAAHGARRRVRMNPPPSHRAASQNPSPSSTRAQGVNQHEAAKTKSGRCYIASVCYGSPEHPDVMTLRRFRDERLLQHIFGRLLISLYYVVSPPLANYLGQKAWLAKLIRQNILAPLARKLRYRS